MITTITKIPCQPTVPNPKPSSNLHFSAVVAKLNLGISGRSRNTRVCRVWWVAERGEMESVRNLSSGCFKGRSSKKERKVEIESANGGEDVFDAAAAEARVQPDHLVIMVNGIIGRCILLRHLFHWYYDFLLSSYGFLSYGVKCDSLTKYVLRLLVYQFNFFNIGKRLIFWIWRVDEESSADYRVGHWDLKVIVIVTYVLMLWCCLRLEPFFTGLNTVFGSMGYNGRISLCLL